MEPKSLKFYWNQPEQSKCEHFNAQLDGFFYIFKGIETWNVNKRIEASTTSNSETFNDLLPFSNYMLFVYARTREGKHNPDLPFKKKILIYDFTNDFRIYYVSSGAPGSCHDSPIFKKVSARGSEPDLFSSVEPEPDVFLIIWWGRVNLTQDSVFAQSGLEPSFRPFYPFQYIPHDIYPKDGAINQVPLFRPNPKQALFVNNYNVRMFLQFPLRQWGASNVYLLVFSS